MTAQATLLRRLTIRRQAAGKPTWIVTTIAPDGAIYYFVGVAPQNDFNTYNLAFQDILDTVKFRN